MPKIINRFSVTFLKWLCFRIHSARRKILIEKYISKINTTRNIRWELLLIYKKQNFKTKTKFQQKSNWSKIVDLSNKSYKKRYYLEWEFHYVVESIHEPRLLLDYIPRGLCRQSCQRWWVNQFFHLAFSLVL